MTDASVMGIARQSRGRHRQSLANLAGQSLHPIPFCCRLIFRVSSFLGTTAWDYIVSLFEEGEGEGILYYLTWLRMTRVLSALTIRS